MKFDAVTLLVKTLANPSVHHELLIFEGLMALTQISSHDESFANKLLEVGCWSNCKELLHEPNHWVVTASIELMANLCLSEQVTRYTKFKIEVDILIALFNKHSIESPDLKLAFAVMTFFANTITFEEVAEIVTHDKTQFIGNVLALLIREDLTQDLAHRILFTLDELKESGIKFHKLLPSKISASNIQ
jgi:hypothetical protein